MIHNKRETSEREGEKISTIEKQDKQIKSAI